VRSVQCASVWPIYAESPKIPASAASLRPHCFRRHMRSQGNRVCSTQRFVSALLIEIARGRVMPIEMTK
jgi:hypothetical protein